VTFQKIKSRYISQPSALAVFEEDLYWANEVKHYDDDPSIIKILSANKFFANNSHSQPTEIVSRLHGLTTGLHIFHAALQIQSKKPFYHVFHDKYLFSGICVIYNAPFFGLRYRSPLFRT